MKRVSEAGFSYIDVMIALVILMVGVLALLSGMSGAVVLSKGQEQQLIAKQIATSTMESIMSVKETDPTRLGWDAVGNVGTNPVGTPPVFKGVFLVGFQPVLPDGGPDEVLGTADDTGAAIPLFQRRITITDECDLDRPSFNCLPPGPFRVRMRSVQVTVTYFVGLSQRQEQLTTVLTEYVVPN